MLRLEKSTMPKKILFYTDTTLTSGAENHILNLIKFLDRKKFTPLLLCSGHENLNEWCRKIKETGCEVTRLITKGKHNPRHFFSLKRIAEEMEIDFLHAHIWNPASGRYAYLAAKTAKKPLITTEHDPFLLPPIKHFIKKYLIKNVSRVIAISGANKELLKKIHPEMREKIDVIHNGIDITWWESQLLGFSKNDRNEFRKKNFNAEKKTKIITCIAELHPRKGLMYLIEAAKLLKEKNPDFVVAIAGRGRLQKAIGEKIKKYGLAEHVKLLGYRKDIPQILASSDLFVLPSLNEAFGLVLLEAMAAKLPVIATKNGGIPEIITNNVTGILVPPKDEKALTYAIIRLMNNEELASRLARAGYEQVKTHFDIKNMVKKTEKVYEEILNTRQARNIN